MKCWSLVSYSSFDVKPKCFQSTAKIKELASLFQYFWRVSIYIYIYIYIMYWVKCVIFIDYRKYAATNISTNLYVISEPWLYSLPGVQELILSPLMLFTSSRTCKDALSNGNDTHLQFSGIFSSCYWSFFLWLSSLSLPEAGWVQAYVDSYRHHFPYSCHDYLCVSLVSLKNRIYHISLWQWHGAAV